MMMRSEATMLLLTLVAVSGFLSPETVAAVVYKVGDAAGWNLGGADFRVWASSQVFHVGDVILFEYNPDVHNVLRVSQDDYRSCNNSSPIASYTSGNDSVTIAGPGHYYYICGFEGHCQGGQKIDIRVLKVPQPTELPNGGPPEQSPRRITPAAAPQTAVASPPAPAHSGGGLSLARLRRHMIGGGVLVVGLSFVFVV